MNVDIFVDGVRRKKTEKDGERKSDEKNGRWWVISVDLARWNVRRAYTPVAVNPAW